MRKCESTEIPKYANAQMRKHIEKSKQKRGNLLCRANGEENKMGEINKTAADLVGNTPLVKLEHFQKKQRLAATVLAKLEFKNIAGSVKDRIAKAMIEDAEARGLLGEGSVIIEPTSGNTGVALAALAVPKGYRVILTMPETMSVERRGLAKAYGAEIVLTDGPAGMKGAIAKAAEIAAATPKSFIPSQFENKANPAAHFAATGPEIWEDTGGKIDIFIAGVGTGGTITGAGKFLKLQNPKLRVVAVEPAASPVLSGGAAGPHKIQGLGAGFVPKTLDTGIYDEIITVKDTDAFAAAKEIAQCDGILAGASSGAALFAAAQVARRQENAGKVIVVIFPDTGERYLSTALFA